MKEKHAPIAPQVNELARQVVDAAYKVHKQLGPGLLETVYELCLEHELQKREIPFERQVTLPIQYDGEFLDAFLRIDFWVDRQLVVEVKAVETLLPVHEAQVLTYLKLTGNRLGLLVNFNVPWIREGLRRFAL